MKHDVAYIINKSNTSQFAYKVNALWGDREPILKLSQPDEAFLNEALAEMGVPKDAWYVCVHAREGGYSPIDENLHAHRNGNIEHLMPSIFEIIKRGGWVIRLGDASTTRLKPCDQVIDYAHHPLRSPRLDVALCAKAKFILGNTSGIFLVGSIFGTPSVLVNMIPMPTLGVFKGDICIPKLYREKQSGDYVRFDKIMKSEISHYRYAELYDRSGLEVVENSAEDILEVTREMLDAQDIDAHERDYNEALKGKYMALFKPEHYSYGACSTVSASFLKKYENLLAIDCDG